MNELEKLREELGDMRMRLYDINQEFHLKLHAELDKFGAVIRRAREIERQARIGEEK